MKNKIEISAAAGMVPSRCLRRRRVFGILSAMGLMSATALIGAERVSNSFVTVEGDGVRIADDGSICLDKAAHGPIDFTARPGWLVNGREKVSVDPSKGPVRGLRLSSKLEEDSQHVHVFPCDDEHIEDIEIGAMATPPDVIAMYAFPATEAEVSASAEQKVVKKGKHRKTYSNCACGEAPGNGGEDETYEVEPDRYEWVTEAAGQRLESSTWTGSMSKGLGQEISFDVTGKRDACPACTCKAAAKAKADVYELSISRPDYIGLDLTDAMKGKYVTRDAIANISPAPARATYSWLECGRCKFIGDKDKAGVTYGATDATGGSESYLAEQLTVKATVENEYGESASAACTTNFTVVKVDVVLPGLSESNEETEGALVSFMSEEVPHNARNWLESVSPLEISWSPGNLPEDLSITIDAPEKTLFEKLGDTYTLVGGCATYSLSEFKSRSFILCGGEKSNLKCDKELIARINTANAIDKSCMTILAYYFVGFVDQPSGGSVWNMDGWSDVEVGHAWWSLECSYKGWDPNISGNGHVNRPVGFYSDGMHDPDTTHVADVTHRWLISRQAFIRGMNFMYARLINAPKYSLSAYNCCNMTADMAQECGIEINRTISTWPFGSGMSPYAFGNDIKDGNWHYEQERNQ